MNDAPVVRARAAFCIALLRRVGADTRLGDVPVQAARDAMTEALEAINNV